MHNDSFKLLDKQGRRKYLTESERKAFLNVTCKAHRRTTRTLCEVLAYTGCTVSEALSLTADRIDIGGEAIILKSLRKRQKSVCRSVPLPAPIIETIDLVHGVREVQKLYHRGKRICLWKMDRGTAYRKVNQTMKIANISGPQATPRGLRHGFAIHMLRSGVPLETVSYWMGYESISSLDIYKEFF